MFSPGEVEGDLTLLHHQQMQHDCKKRVIHLPCKLAPALVNLFLYSVSNSNFIMYNPDIAVPYHCTLLLLFLYIGVKFCFSLLLRGKQSYDMMRGNNHWNFLMDCYEFRNQIQRFKELKLYNNYVIIWNMFSVEH